MADVYLMIRYFINVYVALDFPESIVKLMTAHVHQVLVILVSVQTFMIVINAVVPRANLVSSVLLALCVHTKNAKMGLPVKN